MEEVVGEKLRSLGLIKKIDRQNVRKYFPTYTAHHLGLDAHDMHDKDTLMAPNMVFAVEPGIYIPEEGIGIRIEEDVVITQDGCKVLTNGLSRELRSLTIK
jgi:Xaa-Pro aminopeptidase